MKDYENNKYVDDSNITCAICKMQKMDSYKHLFYRCISCGINLCPLCKDKHIKDSKCKKNIIYYDEINYYCKEHENERINSYCKVCKKNICGGLCQKEHISHNKLNLGAFIPEIEICKENIKEIDKFNANLENMKHILEKVKDNMESILKIYKDIIDNFSERERTYETYSNLKFIENIDKNEVLKELKSINEDNDIKNQFNRIIEIYKKIEKAEKENKEDKDKREGKENKEEKEGKENKEEKENKEKKEEKEDKDKKEDEEKKEEKEKSKQKKNKYRK